MSKQYVINYMGSHSGLASHKRMGNNGKQQRTLQLQKLSEEIKQNCGEEKSPKQIENMWKTAKSKARTYNANKRKHHVKTGNLTDDQFAINSEHEQVLSILGSSHNNGLEIIKESGIHKQPTFVADTMCNQNTSPKEIMAKRYCIRDSHLIEPSRLKKPKLQNNHKIVYTVPNENLLEPLGKAIDTKVNIEVHSRALKNKNLNMSSQLLGVDQLKNAVPKLIVAKPKGNLPTRSICLNLPSIPISASVAKQYLTNADQLLEHFKNNNPDLQKIVADAPTVPINEETVVKRLPLKPKFINLAMPVTNGKVYAIQQQRVNNTRYKILDKPSTPVSKNSENPDNYLPCTSIVSTLTESRNANSLAHKTEYTQYTNAWKNKQSNMKTALQTMSQYSNCMRNIDTSLEKLVAAKQEANAIRKNYYEEKIRIAKAQLDKEKN